MTLSFDRIQEAERRNRETFNVYSKGTFTKAVEYQRSLGMCESIAKSNVRWILTKYKK
ncbi:MAG: hypothetical protein GY787_10600 [Alteromonadales bacterium]|nr:hypothetical protein [Alteromonadales bacterium]